MSTAARTRSRESSVYLGIGPRRVPATRTGRARLSPPAAPTPDDRHCAAVARSAARRCAAHRATVAGSAVRPTPRRLTPLDAIPTGRRHRTIALAPRVRTTVAGAAVARAPVIAPAIGGRRSPPRRSPTSRRSGPRTRVCSSVRTGAVTAPRRCPPMRPRRRRIARSPANAAARCSDTRATTISASSGPRTRSKSSSSSASPERGRSANGPAHQARCRRHTPRARSACPPRSAHRTRWPLRSPPRSGAQRRPRTRERRLHLTPMRRPP